MIEDLFKDIDFTEILDNITNPYEEVYTSKVFYRKIRFKGKIKRRYMFTYNPLQEILPSPELLTLGLRHIGKGGRI